MDDRVLGADGDGDQVAVPPPELLERREQLVALGAALRAPHALLGLAGRQLQRLDGLLGLGARVCAALLDPVEERARRLDRRRRRRRRRRCARRRAASRGDASVGIEQPLEPVEASGGEARDRGELVARRFRRVLQELGADRGLRQPAERDELATRADRLRQRPEVVRDEDDDRVVRRLLEILEQRVRRGLVHRVRVEDHVHAARRLERSHVQVAAQRADLVDQHLVADRLEHVEIRMGPALHAAGVADQRARERVCGAPLADPRRAVEEIRMRRPLRERRGEQALRLVLLRKAVEGHL